MSVSFFDQATEPKVVGHELVCDSTLRRQSQMTLELIDTTRRTSDEGVVLIHQIQDPEHVLCLYILRGAVFTHMFPFMKPHLLGKLADTVEDASKNVVVYQVPSDKGLQ